MPSLVFLHADDEDGFTKIHGESKKVRRNGKKEEKER